MCSLWCFNYLLHTLQFISTGTCHINVAWDGLFHKRITNVYVINFILFEHIRLANISTCRIQDDLNETVFNMTFKYRYRCHTYWCGSSTGNHLIWLLSMNKKDICEFYYRPLLHNTHVGNTSRYEIKRGRAEKGQKQWQVSVSTFVTCQ